MARKRLSADEHLRRGTYQRCRHEDRTPRRPLPDPESFYPWLEGLSPAAQWEGRRFLEQCIPGDCEVFREYLEALAAFHRLPRTRETPIDVLGDAHARCCNLLTLVKWRWR